MNTVITIGRQHGSAGKAIAQKLAEERRCRFCYIHVQRKEVERGEAKVMSVQEFQEVDPMEIACQYAADSGTRSR